MMEYLLHFWGGAEPTIRKELGIESGYYYFNSKKERQILFNKLKRYSHLGLGYDLQESDNFKHQKTIAQVILKYKDEIYNFEYDFGNEYPEEMAHYMFEQGNYSCDCNKSLFIQRECNENFPEMNCGNEVKLIELKIKYVK